MVRRTMYFINSTFPDAVHRLFQHVGDEHQRRLVDAVEVQRRRGVLLLCRHRMERLSDLRGDKERELDFTH